MRERGRIGAVGNTKTYYLEGELLKGVTLQQFKEAVSNGFHSTYCVAEIVEEAGGYLGTGNDSRPPKGGPYLIAAIHTYSMRGDSGPGEVAKLFKDLRMHRLDSDWSDLKAGYWENGRLTHAWTSEAPLNWQEVAPAVK